MIQESSNRRVSRMADLDRQIVRELCDLHPCEMGQLCDNVGLNKSAFSNFLTGRRHLPEKFAPKFLRQIGLTVRGEIDPRHCFYFAVRPGLQDLAAKWISKLFPSGGEIWKIISQERRLVDEDEDEVECEVVELGVVLLNDDNVAVIRDDVHFGDVSWIPGNWTNAGQLPTGTRLLSKTTMPTRKLFDMVIQACEPTVPETSWAEVQAYAEKGGLTADDMMNYLINIHRDRALAAP